MRGRVLAVVAFCLLVASAAQAQRNKLTVGADAPGLDIEKWVQGEETEIEDGSVYVIEFWATWCGPCRRSIPHLSELQEIHGDEGLRIIGISDEDTKTVSNYVQRNRDVMTYTVAVDRRKSTNRAWMQAAGRKGIPSAFIVDKSGKVQWIGNPLDGDFEYVLERVLAGRYDARLEKKARPSIDAAMAARKVRNWRMANKHIDDVLAIDPKIFADLTLIKFEMMLIDQGENEAAYAYARQLLKQYADDPNLLSDLAELIATDRRIADGDRDFALALELAEQAATNFSTNEPERYAGPAKIHYFAGQLDEAIALQKRAVRVARPNKKDKYAHDLEIYRDAAERNVARSS